MSVSVRLSNFKFGGQTLKVSEFRKQIMVSKLLPKNKPSSLSWKITTSRLIQKRVYLLAKRRLLDLGTEIRNI